MMTAIILAGGLGTRLRSVVADRPKPMALVAGQPFLKHLMDYWINQGVTEFVLSVGYLSSIVQEYFGSSYRRCPVTYSVEEQPLGTGGGMLLAMQSISTDNPFLLLNGDTLFSVNLDKLKKFHTEKKSGCTFSLFRATEDNRYMGMDVDTSGRIVGLRSERGVIGDLANGGVYLIDPTMMRKHYDCLGDKLSLESDIFARLLSEGEAVYGMECDGPFIDIGVPDDYLRASTVVGVQGD
ncbi:NTP transferase domain-containing protein [Thalassospira sp. NFXS8]|uniref:sugar phosphate nucleotidyltransferase n=1 Tax=Thalassospira sp. NFXS8 TaxID=2819093 RepID=UPI0032DEF518